MEKQNPKRILNSIFISIAFVDFQRTLYLQRLTIRKTDSFEFHQLHILPYSFIQGKIVKEIKVWIIHKLDIFYNLEQIVLKC